MKRFRVITTTNDNENYIHFWPTVAKNYSNAFGFPITLGYITEKNEDDPVVKKMKKYGDVILFKSLIGIDSGVQSKVTRMFLCTRYPEEYCIIVDIDMYLLDYKFAFDNWFSKVDDSNLIAVGSNAYSGKNGNGKFPMCYATSKGETFQKIVNPNGFEYDKLINSWKNVEVIDGKESISNHFHNFSDESLLRVLIRRLKNNNLVQYISREDFRGFFTRRIDRSRWNLFSENKMKNGFYIDCVPLRPFNNNIDKLSSILEYMKIDKNDWITLN